MASSWCSFGSLKSVPATRSRRFVKCCVTAPIANSRNEPVPGAPSPDQPVISAGRRRPESCPWSSETCRPSVCGTPRITNFVVGLLKPSRFSRIKPIRPHQGRAFELRQRRVELRHEQRIVGRPRGDEGRIDREVVVRRVTGSAGPAVSVERLLEEQRPRLARSACRASRIRRTPLTKFAPAAGRIWRSASTGRAHAGTDGTGPGSRRSVSAARSGTSAEQARRRRRLVEEDRHRCCHSRALKRLKNIFWKTFTDPAPSARRPTRGQASRRRGRS